MAFLDTEFLRYPSLKITNVLAIFRIVAKAGYDKVTGAELESCEPSYSDLDSLATYAGVFRQADNISSRSVGDHLKRTVTALLLTRSAYKEVALEIIT